MSVNVNMDFRQPLIDTLKSLQKVQEHIIIGMAKTLTYIDRYRAPVTMINNANIIPYSFVINEVNVEDKMIGSMPLFLIDIGNTSKMK